VLPGDGLRAIAMVQVKVDYRSVRQAVVEKTVHDSNMDIVDPTETGRV
jgi:hypothetical protein